MDTIEKENDLEYIRDLYMRLLGWWGLISNQIEITTSPRWMRPSYIIYDDYEKEKEDFISI